MIPFGKTNFGGFFGAGFANSKYQSSYTLFLTSSILPFLTFSIVATLGLIFTVLVPLPSKMIKIIWFYKLCHLFQTWQEGNFQSHLAHSFPGLGLISIEAETVELKGAAKMKSN